MLALSTSNRSSNYQKRHTKRVVYAALWDRIPKLFSNLKYSKLIFASLVTFHGEESFVEVLRGLHLLLTLRGSPQVYFVSNEQSSLYSRENR